MVRFDFDKVNPALPRLTLKTGLPDFIREEVAALPNVLGNWYGISLRSPRWRPISPIWRSCRDRLFGKTPGSVDAQLQKLRRATCPFINSPEKNQRQMGPRDYAGSHENVAAGSNLYCWPGSNLLSGARQPASSTSLLGLRTDKEAKDFVRE
jgi:hypothetical protein